MFNLKVFTFFREERGERVTNSPHQPLRLLWVGVGYSQHWAACFPHFLVPIRRVTPLLGPWVRLEGQREPGLSLLRVILPAPLSRSAPSVQYSEIPRRLSA